MVAEVVFKIFQNREGQSNVLVHFEKLYKNDFKSTISLKAPTNLHQKN